MKNIWPAPELTFDDVLLLPQFTDYIIDDDHRMTDLTAKVSKHLTLSIPLTSSPMPHVTESDMAIALAKAGGLGFIHNLQSPERQLEQVSRVKQRKLRVAAVVSDFSKSGEAHVSHLLKLNTDLICIETAQAFNRQTLAFVRKIRARFPKSELCASLVVTGDATRALIEAGVDSIRIGIGGGSHCTTRLVTGIGRPQLSALAECAKVAKKHHVPLISDTGIRYSGDIVKAIAFGADCVMIGGLFSGTTESPGEIVSKHGKRFKYSAGMCADQSSRKKRTLYQHYNLTKYRLKLEIKKIVGRASAEESIVTPFTHTEEGVAGLVPYKGSVKTIIGQLENGVRRGMWYLGAHRLSDIPKVARYVVVTPNTMGDNLPRI